MVSLKAFLAGFVTLSLEILAPRLFSIYFGLSHFTWTVLICAFLLGLTLGYQASERRILSKKVLLGIVVVNFVLLFFYDKIYSSLLMVNLSFKMRMVVASISFIPLAAVMGYLSPKFVEETGLPVREASSRIGKFVCLGSIAGALVTGQVFFALFNNYQILLILLLMTLFIFIPNNRRWIGVVLLIFLVVPIWSDNSYKSVIQPITLKKLKDRIVLSTGLGAQNIFMKKNPFEDIPGYYKLVLQGLNFKREVKDVLLLGGGGNMIATRLLQDFPALKIDSVELDPVITQIAIEYFQADRKINFHHQDARQFVRGTKKRYDIIILDCYQGLSPPIHLTTVEFFRELKKILNLGGIVISNYYDNPETKDLPKLLSTFQREFAFMKKAQDDHNHVVYGSQKELHEVSNFYQIMSSDRITDYQSTTKKVYTDDKPHPY